MESSFSAIGRNYEWRSGGAEDGVHRPLTKDVSYRGLMDRASKLCHVIMNHFGGVENALRKAGINPVFAVRHRRWNRAMIIKEIRLLNWESLDRTAIQYQRLQKAARSHCGGWKAALQMAGRGR